jgi:hypothetical protein
LSVPGDDFGKQRFGGTRIVGGQAYDPRRRAA